MEQLRVQWTEFPNSLAGALGQLQHAGELADVTLACEGRRIHAHKLVLSACSPYFRDAFKENPCHHPIIILKDVQAQDILYLLSYMYRGEVNVEENKLSSFIQTAELLQIKGLSTGVTNQTKKPTPTLIPKVKNPSNTVPPIKKIVPSNNPPKEASNPPQPIKIPIVQQKKRRNSVGERPSEPNVDAKKLKPLKEKSNNIRKNDSSPSENNNKKSESLLKPETNLTDLNPHVEIKHEVPDISDFEESMDESRSPKNHSAPSSPNPFYETSMLARSLISGAQALKNDIQVNSAAAMNKPKPQPPAPVQSVPPPPPPQSNLEETLVKTERMSPRSDLMEIEPEVLISEQEDSLARIQIPKAVTISAVPRTTTTADGGASTSSGGGSGGGFNQTNHAAICGDCPHCGTKYSNQSALKYHVRLMHSDLTNRLCCYLCPRSFTIRDTFKEHMWTSHGQRN